MSDIDTVALTGFKESDNRKQFIHDHCREMYGNVSPYIHAMAALAFKEVAQINGISCARRYQRRFAFSPITL